MMLIRQQPDMIKLRKATSSDKTLSDTMTRRNFSRVTKVLS